MEGDAVSEGEEDSKDEYWKEMQETLEGPTSEQVEDVRVKALITIVSVYSTCNCRLRTDLF